jgi:hypothetical protein
VKIETFRKNCTTRLSLTFIHLPNNQICLKIIVEVQVQIKLGFRISKRYLTFFTIRNLIKMNELQTRLKPLTFIF